jgi:hypothetical protein
MSAQCPVCAKADVGWAIYEYTPFAEFLSGDLTLPSPIVSPVFPLGHLSGPTDRNIMHGTFSLTRSFRVYKEPESQRWILMTLPPPPTIEPAAPSAAAERMRRHRQRRRDGLRCLMIELRETEIDALIRNGLLPPENRHDYDSVQSALYAFLDDALGENA